MRTASAGFVTRDRKRGFPVVLLMLFAVAWTAGVTAIVVGFVVRSVQDGPPANLLVGILFTLLAAGTAVGLWLGIRAFVRPGPPVLTMDAEGVHRITPMSVSRLVLQGRITSTLPWKEIAEVGVRAVDHTDDARPGPDAAALLARIGRFADWNRASCPRRRSAPSPPPRIPAGRVVVTVRLIPGARSRRFAYLCRMGDAGRHRDTAAQHGRAGAAAELDALRTAVSAWVRGRDDGGPQLVLCCALPSDEVDLNALHRTVRRHTGGPARELGRLGPGDLDTPLRVADALADVAEAYAEQVSSSGPS